MTRQTITAKIIDYVRAHPGATITDVARALTSNKHRYVMGTYSGIMNRLCKRRVLMRQRGIGPRGGYGYWTGGAKA